MVFEFPVVIAKCVYSISIEARILKLPIKCKIAVKTGFLILPRSSLFKNHIEITPLNTDKKQI